MGELIRHSGNGKNSLYELDLGNGRKVFTFVGAALNPKGGQPVNDAEMVFARSLVRTRRLAHRTALRRHLVLVNVCHWGARLFYWPIHSGAWTSMNRPSNYS